MLKAISFRGWLTVITFALLGVMVYFAWPEISKAWDLLWKVNLVILSLLIPIQLFSYFAMGNTIFSYLRSKGDLLNMSRWRMTRTALELNFVNHVFPSGGAAGFSYLGWVLSKYGVSVSRTSMAQVVRFVLMLVSFIVVLLTSVVVLMLDYEVNRSVVLVSGAIAILCVGGLIGIILIIGSRNNMKRFASWVTRVSNRVVSFFTRKKKKNVVKENVLVKFFEELHDDYVSIQADRRILIKPFIWSLLMTLSNIMIVWVTFMSLGEQVNPALLFIACGFAAIVSVFAMTPGGAGVYEAVLVAFLVSSGLSLDIALAGILLSRVIVLLGTIVFGYVFYQLTILKHGKHTV